MTKHTGDIIMKSLYGADANILKGAGKMKKKLSFIVSLTLVLALLAGSFSTSAFAKNSVDKTLKFGSDGKFTILQIADIQDRPVLKFLTRQYLTDVIKRVQPDLIVLTGDNISGKACKAGTHTLEKLKD